MYTSKAEMSECVVEGDEVAHGECPSRTQVILREVQIGDETVLLHHGGDGHTPFRPEAIVTEVQVCHRGIGLG